MLQFKKREDILKFTALKTELSKGIKPAYLIYGNDRYLCYSALETIKKALNITLPELNEILMDGTRATADSIAESAAVFPFMDKYRLVVVSDFNPKTKPKEDRLLKHLLGKVEGSVIIFFNLSGHDGLKPYLGEIEAVDCDKLSPEMLMSILSQKLQKSEAKMDRAALEKLIMFCNCDMARISSELEKLISYAGGRNITSEDVSALVVEDKEYQIFELAEFIAKGDSFKALDLIDRLTLDKKGGFSILTPLYNNYRRVLYVSINKDKSDAELAALLSVKEYAVKMVKNQSRVFTPKKLKKIVDFLYNTDRDIKLGKIKEDVAIKTAAAYILKLRG